LVSELGTQLYILNILEMYPMGSYNNYALPDGILTIGIHYSIEQIMPI